MTEICIPCAACNGWGELQAESADGESSDAVVCPYCDGTGATPDPDYAPLDLVPHDPVSRPAHYDFAIQPIDFIEAAGLGFHEANVVKYVSRAKHKGSQLQDLEKARFYLDRLISKLKEQV
jgi:hypothetical protein